MGSTLTQIWEKNGLIQIGEYIYRDNMSDVMSLGTFSHYYCTYTVHYSAAWQNCVICSYR